MKDPKLCKRIAEIEGVGATNYNDIIDYNLYVVTGDDFYLNYLTSKALLFDLMIKYGVVVKPHKKGFTDIFIDDYRIHITTNEDDQIPRAILECIVEANS